MDAFPEEGGRYLIRDFASRLGTNIAAAGNRTLHLTHHQAVMRTQADWNIVCPPEDLGVRTTLLKPLV